MRWYADNSELYGVRGASIPDILLFGGIAIEVDQVRLLREAIESVKEKYGHPRAPVKWNFKALKALYKKQKLEELYEKLLKSSKEWRIEIAEIANDFNFRVKTKRVRLD